MTLTSGSPAALLASLTSISFMGRSSYENRTRLTAPSESLDIRTEGSAHIAKTIVRARNAAESCDRVIASILSHHAWLRRRRQQTRLSEAQAQLGDSPEHRAIHAQDAHDVHRCL